jgi:uncharacterized protein (DUF1697 family)
MVDSPPLMLRYVAFLRAVNVGGRTVKMDELRAVVSKAGFADVETFIASGNVVFSSSARSAAAIERTIEHALSRSFGFEVPTFVRTIAEVVEAARRAAFTAKDVEKAGAYLVAFLKSPPDAKGRTGLQTLESSTDRFAVEGREVYWLSTPKQSESALTLVKFERAIGGPATMRSMTSLAKLAAKHGS